MARKDPYKNFMYRVEIDGIVQAGFSEVVIPEASAEVIEYREGNEPSMVRKLPGRISYDNLILKWGLSDSRELYNWWKAVMEGNIIRKNISIVIMDDKKTDAVRWNILNAWPAKYKPSNLDAKGKETAIEKLELAIEGIELVLI
jgi:phage tail-like protein